jgi:uncharacterized protein with HEPN domain
MLSDAAIAALRDMERHISLAAHFIAGFDYDEFRDDARTVYAVTRCLEIISEASRRLPNEMKARYPSIAWKNMAGAGNVYRHDYEDVAAKLVWDTVQLALPPLRDVVAREIAALE